MVLSLSALLVPCCPLKIPSYGKVSKRQKKQWRVGMVLVLARPLGDK